MKNQPEKILETVQEDVPQATGEYLRQIMRVEFSKFLDRDLYERTEDEPNPEDSLQKGPERYC